MSEMGKTRHDYTDEFRQQIVRLVTEGGKSCSEVAREYGVSATSVSGWVRRSRTSGSFRDMDNLTEDQRENKALRKENARLRMENDLLKQAALILGRR